MDVLARYEQDIENYEKSYQKCARALVAIKEGELWSENYFSFEEYCKVRWQFGKSRADQLLKAGSLLIALETSTIVEPPQNEGIAREVLKVKVWEKDGDRWKINAEATEKKRVDTWEMVSSQSNGEAMTAADVRDLIDINTGRGAKGGPSEDKQRKAEKARIWKAINTLADAPMTPKQLLSGMAAPSHFPQGHKALRFLNKLMDSIDS